MWSLIVSTKPSWRCGGGGGADGGGVVVVLTNVKAIMDAVPDAEVGR
jgi:hypothetical protein